MGSTFYYVYLTKLTTVVQETNEFILTDDVLDNFSLVYWTGDTKKIWVKTKL